MFLYESKDGEKTVEIDSALLVTGDSKLAIFLTRHLQNLNVVAPITSFNLAQTANDAFPAFTYDIVLKDGRTWHQTITFSGGILQEPTMTFAVTDQWKLSEFSLQRPLRDLIVEHVASHGLSRIEAVWF